MLSDRRGSPAVYKTLRRLGTGGMAEVFLARQEGVAGFRRLAVVKRLLPQFSSMSSVAEMLLDEARIAAQLTHPNIVQIYELGQEEDQYFIAMEYVDGCDLATLARIERRRKSRVPMRLVLRVVSEAAQGLDYAHRQAGLDGRPLSLVHRDVSPHNILCSREGAVKVTDFGIAKAVGKVQVTEVGVVKGKVHYMSPEQYTGDEVDKRSDVFSLGVVLYQLTTGRLPRVTRSGQVNMRQVAEGVIPHPSELRPDYPAELEKIVMCALANSPGDRYQDCAGLRDDLLNFGRDHDLIAFPKELGDYVSALVPPLTLTEEAAANDAATAGRSLAAAGPPSLVRGTERVPSVQPTTSPGHRNLSGLRSITSHAEDRDTEIPIQSEEPQPAPSTDPSIVYLGSEARRPVVGLEERLRGRRAPRAGAGDGPTAGGGASPLPPAPGEALEDHVTTGGGSPSPPPARDAGPGRGGGVERSRPTPPRREERTALERPQPRQVAERATNPGPWIAFTLVVVVVVVASVLLLAMRREDRLFSSGALAPAGLQQPSAGGLDVWSKPEAAVFVDGAQRCARTPCSISGLPLGRELLVTVRGSADYNLWVQRAVLTPQQPRLLLEAVLMPLAPVARQTAVRAAARDGGGSHAPTHHPGRGATGGTSEGAAPNHAAGASPAGATAAATPGSRGKGKVSIGKAEGAETILASDVRPGWAEVFVDDKSVGHTPLQVAIEPGRHVVELKNEQFGFHAVYRINARPRTKTKITDQIAQPKAPEPSAPAAESP